MIRKEQVRIGMRIVGDDPESPESYPYKEPSPPFARQVGTRRTFTCHQTGRGIHETAGNIKVLSRRHHEVLALKGQPRGKTGKTEQYPFPDLYGCRDIPGIPLLHPYGRRQEEPSGIPSRNGRQLFRSVIRPGTGMRL